ncbi:neuroblast differentiation-associated protein AHNAK-like [Scomber japonicus]|uniref:neuroblast differentiation-associated protein AHNAK-like n=1 Tax=Scomber japonicus TaxID=13676 RepID=UPI0023057614|nr:neuroblast differentiation-associated protein AHNAK-like [Scomber japonicus]
MAEEEETREVLFPDWEGPDKTGLTIEQTREGEIFVKEVKGESPAARSGKVYEGDQIVGATIYFDNMSSTETAELLKTLNRHKVGLKLQNKGDKSPYCSPLSTPCRSPMGTLTWEGKTRFGGSSPDIILSGDDEDYKRIYTKKIKPRLKSEDLAEGVDVRTERHSSTSSDGSTITTITRRITTYTVDMPSGISEQLELSSSELKGLRHESGDGSPHSPSGNVGTEEGVFDSSSVSYTGPQLSSTETRWGTRGVQTTTITGDVERESGLRFKGPNFGVTGGKGQGGFEISRGSGEHGDGSIQVSETSMALRDSTTTGSRHVTKGELGGAEAISTDENGGSVGLGGVRIGGSKATLGYVTSGYSSGSGKISVAGMDVNLTGSKLKSEVDVNLPSSKGGIKTSGIDTETDSTVKMSTIKMPAFGMTGVKKEGTSVEVKLSSDADMSVPLTYEEVQKPEIDIKGTHMIIKGPSANIEGPAINVRRLEADSDIKTSEINSSIQAKIEM